TPSRAGIDGGMNPVFQAKLSPSFGFDNSGRTYQVASAGSATPPRFDTAPGALSRDTTPPAAAPVKTAEPAAVASKPAAAASKPVAVATARSAPQPKQTEAPAPEEKPTTIAGMIGSWFGRSPDPAAPPEKDQAGVRAANTDMAAKPKQAAPVRA